MTENREPEFENIWIDDSEDAVAERYALALERLSSYCGEEIGEEDNTFFSELLAVISEKNNNNSEIDGTYPKKHTYSAFFRAAEVLFFDACGMLPLGRGGRKEDQVKILETAVQILSLCEEKKTEGELPAEKEVRKILYSYLFDYAETYLSEQIAFSEEKKESPRRLIPEFVFSASPESLRLMEPYFGDRMKAHLLEITGALSEKNRQYFTEHRIPAEPETLSVPESGSRGFLPEGERNRNLIRAFFHKASVLALSVLLCFSLSCCGHSEKAPEEDPVIQETEAEPYPGMVTAEDENGNRLDSFGVMHALVLEVQGGEKDGLYIYTLRDNNDPDNAWSLNSQNIGDIIADVQKGSTVSVLFSGDISGDPDKVEFIAILEDQNYSIRKAEGTMISNMMSSFILRTVSGEELTFRKDNCRIDRDALSTQGQGKVVVYYADSGHSALYPVRVYREETLRKGKS